MFLKPKDGLSVFDPALSDYLPPEGREVGPLAGHGFYWLRRVNDGDVDILDEKAAKASLDAAEKKREAEAAEVEKARRDALTPEARAAEDKAAADAKKKG